MLRAILDVLSALIGIVCILISMYYYIVKNNDIKGLYWLTGGWYILLILACYLLN